MGYTVEFDDNAPEYRMVVIRLDSPPGHRCGYVSVPESNELFGVGYEHKVKTNPADVLVNPTDPVGTLLASFGTDNRISISYLAGVHGGITYAAGNGEYPVPGGGWWFGFDAGHYGDDDDGGRSLYYMKNECELLKVFLQGYAKAKGVMQLTPEGSK